MYTHSKSWSIGYFCHIITARHLVYYCLTLQSFLGAKHIDLNAKVLLSYRLMDEWAGGESETGQVAERERGMCNHLRLIIWMSTLPWGYSIEIPVRNRIDKQHDHTFNSKFSWKEYPKRFWFDTHMTKIFKMQEKIYTYLKSFNLNLNFHLLSQCGSA